MRPDLITAMISNIAVVWDVMPCTQVIVIGVSEKRTDVINITENLS
jgi:hypothetical protein